MPIYGDILKAADDADFAPVPAIGADFFSNGMSLPAEESPSPKADETPVNPLRDWRFVVDRALMLGRTAEQVLSSLNLENAPEASEITAYVRKYEGLMGTVFLDCEVLERGTPLSLIPKAYRPYNAFAICCGSPVTKTVRRISGGLSGDIDAFLNSADGVEEEKIEVCRTTGLPILKRGMFTGEVISGIMAKLGLKGDTVPELRQAMRERVMGLGAPKAAPVSEKPDLEYGLRPQGQDLPIPEAPKDAGLDFGTSGGTIPVERPVTAMDASAFALRRQAGQEVRFAPAGEEFVPGMSLRESRLDEVSVRPSAEAEVSFAPPQGGSLPIAERPSAEAEDLDYSLTSGKTAVSAAPVMRPPEALGISLEESKVGDVTPSGIAGPLGGISLDGSLRY